MPSCPECQSHNVSESPCSPDYRPDGQGYEWTYVHNFSCEDCGCEFTVTRTTTRSVEIDKHGDEWNE